MIGILTNSKFISFIAFYIFKNSCFDSCFNDYVNVLVGKGVVVPAVVVAVDPIKNSATTLTASHISRLFGIIWLFNQRIKKIKLIYNVIEKYDCLYSAGRRNPKFPESRSSTV